MLSSSVNEFWVMKFPLNWQEQTWRVRVDSLRPLKIVAYYTPCRASSQKIVVTTVNKASGLVPLGVRSHCKDLPAVSSSTSHGEPGKRVQKPRKKQHHLWNKRDSALSGQKALNLIRNISGLPNEREAVYGALNKWIAWETEFPLIAAAKALRMLRKRSQWIRVIQVAKWMLSKGQGATMETYDTLLLAFDMDRRIDEAQSLWDMILKVHTRSTSKRLFSRMVSLYDHHHLPDKVIEVFADMEELGVRPDEDTLKRIVQAFDTLGQADKKKLVLSKYQSKWKYIHFNGERVRVRNDRLTE